MAVIYLFIVSYSLSWGPCAWIYTGEMYPNRFRDYGMAMSTMVVWSSNFIVSRIAPIALLNIGWRTWTIFGTMNACACCCAVFLPELKGRTLEDTDVIFGVVPEGMREIDVKNELDMDSITHGKKNGGTSSTKPLSYPSTTYLS